MKNCDSGEDRTINCPRCRRPNPVELIYCAVPDCAAVLHPGRTACDACRAAIPVNARFCPDCGHPTGYQRGTGDNPVTQSQREGSQQE